MQHLTNQLREIAFYQKKWQAQNFKNLPDQAQLQIITKKELNESFPTQWMTPRLQKAISEHEVEWAATSGTTSERLQIVRPKDWWMAEYTWLDKHLFPAKKQPKRVVLTTALCSAAVCSMTQPSYRERCLENVLYLNIHHDPNVWQQADLERMIKEMEDWQADYLLADPVYLLIFLQKAHIRGIAPKSWSFGKVILGYEYLTNFNRRLIASTFAAQEIRQLYGSTETGFHILEDGKGNLRCYNRKSRIICKRWKANIFEVIISSWKNPFMPLVHYAIGDLVQLQDQTSDLVEDPGTIKQFQGRKKDIIQIGKTSYCLGEVERCLQDVTADILQYQLKVGISQISFHYTTLSDQPLKSDEERQISSALNELMHPSIKLSFKWRSTISPESSGKFSIIKKL